MAASKGITFKDEDRPNGGVSRSYYCGGVHKSTVRIDAGASESQKRAALADELRYLGNAPAAIATARPAPAVASEPAPLIKNPERLAREGLYQACLDRGGPTFDDAAELGREIGVAAATELIRQHGACAGMMALAQRVYGPTGNWPTRRV